MALVPITPQYILNMFDNSDLIQIEKTDETLRRTERVPQKRKLEEYGFSPDAKRILAAHTPITRKYLEGDFLEDDMRLLRLEEKQEEKDESFEVYENKEVGVFLERWICANLKCPACLGKLVKYASNNMPVVDIMCSNKDHDAKFGPKYYQVKSTEQGKLHMGQPYFSLKDKYIKVGSTRFGKPIHEVTLGDEENKKILIGYICIEYIYPDRNNMRRITINMNTSFFVVPDLTKVPANDDERRKSYYKYIENSKLPKIPQITFDQDLCDVYLLKQINLDKINIKIDIFKNIDLNQRFVETDFFMNDIPPPKL